MARQAPRKPTSTTPPSALVTAGGGLIGGAPPAAAAAAGLGASAKAQKDAVTKAVEAVLGMLRAIDLRRRRILRRQIGMAFPQSDIDAALAEEARREVVFRKLTEQRVRDGMRLATAAKDPSARAAAIQGVLTRERRFAEQRARASGERVLAAAEFQELRVLSPQGGYWSLGPRRTHTPDCIAMNGHFWPWEILEQVHPLLHVGCGCFLLSFGEAIRRGLMTADAIMDKDEARRLAAPVIRHIKEEEAEAARKYGHLAEDSATEELRVRVALLEHNADTDLMAATPLAADILTPPAPPWVREAAEHADGAMVALYPDRRRAKKLAIRGGEEPEELHITLAFLGKAEGLDLAKAKAAVSAWAKKTPPQSGNLSGIGHFDIGDGKKVTYRSVDLPDIAQPREDLVGALKKAGTPASEDHGFTPHMTIDYGIRRPPIEKAPIRFSKVTLTWGEDQHVFPLEGGKVSEDFDPDQPRDVLGRWVEILDAPGTEKIDHTAIVKGDILDLTPTSGKARVRVAVRRIIHTDKKGRPTFAGTRIGKDRRQGATTNYSASVNSDVVRHGNVQTGSVEPAPPKRGESHNFRGEAIDIMGGGTEVRFTRKDLEVIDVYETAVIVEDVKGRQYNIDIESWQRSRDRAAA